MKKKMKKRGGCGLIYPRPDTILPSLENLPLKELMLVPIPDTVETEILEASALVTLTSEGCGEPAEDSFPMPFSPVVIAVIP